MNRASDRLVGLLRDPGLIELPGCYDALSAKILERVGFPAVFLSGYSVAASLLGNPDIGLTTLAETIQVTRNIANVLRVPLIVDADNGYGNEDSVIRTVRELEIAGAAAVVLEDQVMPKRCGHSASKEVVPLPVYMKKLETALKARRTDMCIVGRTDSTSLDDAIQRAKAFHAAGADILLIDGLKSLDQMKRVADEVPGHKQVNLIYGGLTPILPAKELHAIGFKIIQYSTPALYIAAHGLMKQLEALRESHDLRTIGAASLGFAEFQGLVEQGYRERIGDAGAVPTAAPSSPSTRTASPSHIGRASALPEAING